MTSTVNNRRRLVVSSALAFAAGCTARGMEGHSAPARPTSVTRLSPRELLDDVERRTFNFFWDTTNPANGLVCDRWPTQEFASIGAVGFGLTAYPIGVERGYVTRAQAAARVLTTARFFRNAPQGPQATGTAGYKGFFYRFLNMQTGTRILRPWTDAQTGTKIYEFELSTMDTALLMGGMLFCRAYFDRPNTVETEIRRLIDEIEARIDWNWAQPRAPAICHGWHPETGFIQRDWLGYCEAMIVYILALGSPTHAVPSEAWSKWCSTYDASWGTVFGQEYLTFPPLFVHQYTHTWIDFRGIRDAYMRRKDLDYFDNSRRATYAQRAYTIANPMGWKGYGENVWGMTGCDGPANVVVEDAGRKLRFRAYSARGVGTLYTDDDGTIAPPATASSIAFAPEIVLPALQQMANAYGDTIYGQYGFLDAFNLSFDYDKPLHFGRRAPGFGWVDIDYLGIDQGSTLAMIANHRSDLVWRTMRGHPTIRRGLERAGFIGGWLDKPAVRPRQG
jgi:hypothetical protein